MQLAMTRYRRYSGNDRHFGPFITWSRHGNEHWRPFGVVLDSGDGDDYKGCNLALHACGRTLIIELPPILKPWRQWVPTGHYHWAKSPDAGYWDAHRREFGFRYSGDTGFLQVFLGAQTHDSTTTKSWCKSLPWKQWRHVRHSMYGLSGEHHFTQLDADRRKGGDHWEARQAAEKSCPVAKFLFRDFDGMFIVATARMEEREWHLGEGWFKWLSVFRKPRVHRSLDLEFSQEVGKDKGSWKGGTLGHGIEMLPGEDHEAAFRRYCAAGSTSKHGPGELTFVRRLEE